MENARVTAPETLVLLANTETLVCPHYSDVLTMLFRNRLKSGNPNAPLKSRFRT